MLLLAHTGITLGIGWLIRDRTAARMSTVDSHTVTLSSNQGQSEIGSGSKFTSKKSFLTQLASMDLRILILGSMLPDIIDKPLGILILRNSVDNGRIYAHTLLFLMVLILSAVILYQQQNKLWLFLLAGGSLVHLVLDEMWQLPQTLLWPLYTWHFPREEIVISDWMGLMWNDLFSYPRIYIPEAIGLVVLVAFIIFLDKKRKVLSFILYG